MTHQPLITIYEPTRTRGRWTARATVRTKGETIELQATASDNLARRAQGWYSRGAEFVHRWVDYQSASGSPGHGVFGDLPEVAYAVADSATAIPFDADIEQAAALFAGCKACDAEALAQVEHIAASAPTDEGAAAALDRIQLIERVTTQRGDLPLPAIFAGAHLGDPDAREVVAALRATRQMQRPYEPVRLGWHVEDYVGEHTRLPTDLEQATSDEFGARIIYPHGPSVRRVKPSLQGPMLRTFQQLLAAYG